jgi:hypothetical protein
MPKPDHLLFNADDVRTELHKVRDQLQRDKDEHIRNWEKSPSGHEDPKTCLPCKLWDARIQGCDRAVRHFRGRCSRG